MNQNNPSQNQLEKLEKLMALLNAEIVAIRQTGDIALMHNAQLEIERVCKIRDDLESKKTLLPLESLVMQTKELYLEKLAGREEAEINGWLVTYKPGERFALDTSKVTEFLQQEGYSEEETKNLLYSHSTTKPSLKFKTLKK